MRGADDEELDLPKKKKKKKPKPASSGLEDRLTSYLIGAFLFLLGLGLMVGFFLTQRAPARLFNLLAAGGIAALLSGIGLFIYPLDGERLHAFRNEPNPIAVFKIMPVFWKVWLLVILAGMIGGFILVAQVTVRVP